MSLACHAMKWEMVLGFKFAFIFQCSWITLVTENELTKHWTYISDRVTSKFQMRVWIRNSVAIYCSKEQMKFSIRSKSIKSNERVSPATVFLGSDSIGVNLLSELTLVALRIKGGWCRWACALNAAHAYRMLRQTKARSDDAVQCDERVMRTKGILIGRNMHVGISLFNEHLEKAVANGWIDGDGNRFSVVVHYRIRGIDHWPAMNKRRQPTQKRMTIADFVQEYCRRRVSIFDVAIANVRDFSR